MSGENTKRTSSAKKRAGRMKPRNGTRWPESLADEARAKHRANPLGYKSGGREKRRQSGDWRSRGPVIDEWGGVAYDSARRDDVHNFVLKGFSSYVQKDSIDVCGNDFLFWRWFFGGTTAGRPEGC